jgi:hypothetical protein
MVLKKEDGCRAHQCPCQRPCWGPCILLARLTRDANARCASPFALPPRPRVLEFIKTRFPKCRRQVYVPLRQEDRGRVAFSPSAWVRNAAALAPPLSLLRDSSQPTPRTIGITRWGKVPRLYPRGPKCRWADGQMGRWADGHRGGWRNSRPGCAYLTLCNHASRIETYVLPVAPLIPIWHG